MSGRSRALGLVGLLYAASVSGQFCPGVTPWVFDDVPLGDPFCGSITWMAQEGVTLGCATIDTNHRLYCPADFVRRDQMAAFMSRLNTALFPTTCAPGQVMKWNGAAWTCSDDNIGGGGGGGTVTSVLAGTGLQASPNPIVGAGSINLAPSYQLPQGCSNGQVAKSNGSGGWTCAADGGGVGTVTSITAGTGLTGGTITGSGTIAADTNYLQRRVTATCAAGSSIRAIAANGTVTCETDDVGPANAFVNNGNAFGATAVLGTTDNQALDVRVNGSRVMRYEPNAISPNVIGGNPSNWVQAGVRGATVAGGGAAIGDSDPDFDNEEPNRVADHYGTVGGGLANRAGSTLSTPADRPFATVAGGYSNTASGSGSTVGGGYDNTASDYYSTVAGGGLNTSSNTYSTVGGGASNTSSGGYSTVGGGVSNASSGINGTVGGGSGNTASGGYSTVGGGETNASSGIYGTVGGGDDNVASGSGSTVGGGSYNQATGDRSIVAGGLFNIASGRGSFAAGIRAATQTRGGTPTVHNGAFVWADASTFSTGYEFNSTAANEFSARATGGVRFVTAISGTGLPTWTCGVSGGAGGSWGCSSDRNLKTDLVPLDGAATLARLVDLPIYQWVAKGDERRVPHAGPTAQDFMAAFGLGDNDKMIGFADAQGVLFSAVQGLNAKLEAQVAAKNAEIAALKREVADLRAANQKEIADLRLAIEVLMARTAGEGRVAQTR